MFNYLKKVSLSVILATLLIGNVAVAANNLNFKPVLIAPISAHSTKTISERETARDVTLAFYYYEDGPNKNLKKAKFWVEQGVKKQDKDSFFLLGMMHLRGDAAKKDMFLALDNLKEAAEQDHKQANEILGLIYYYGVDVEIDLDEAYMYLSEVGSEASPESKTILGKLYYNGDAVAQNYEEAFKYVSEAAQAKHPEAQAMLSVMYKKGQGVTRDLEKSYKWMMEAANKNIEARLLMGMKYESGEGVPVDLQEAYFYYYWAKDGAYPDKSKIPADNRFDKLINRLKPKMTSEQLNRAETLLKAKLSVRG